jgi:hypothetical protein
MELLIGPFDPAAHIRARDHYQALRREAALLGLDPASPPRRYEELVGRLYQQLGLAPVTEAVDRAFVAGEPAFRACAEVAEADLPVALRTCDDLAALLEELDDWARQSGGELPVASPEVHAYQRAFLDQVRAQLQAPASPAGD